MKVKELIGVVKWLDNINSARYGYGRFTGDLRRSVERGTRFDIAERFKRCALKTLTGRARLGAARILSEYSRDKEYKKIVDDLVDQAAIHSLGTKNDDDLWELYDLRLEAPDEKYYGKPIFLAIMKALKMSCAVKVQMEEGYVTLMSSKSKQLVAVRSNITESDRFCINAISLFCGHTAVNQHPKMFTDQIIDQHVRRSRVYNNKISHNDIVELIDKAPTLDIRPYVHWMEEKIQW